MLGAITLLMFTPFYIIYKSIYIDNKTLDKQFILISDVVEELSNKNIDIKLLKYHGDLYGQYKNYPFRKLDIDDIIDCNFCIRDSLIMCSIFPNRIKFKYVSIKRSDFNKMLREIK